MFLLMYKKNNQLSAQAHRLETGLRPPLEVVAGSQGQQNNSSAPAKTM